MTPGDPPRKKQNHFHISRKNHNKILKHFKEYRSLLDLYLYDQRLSPIACSNTTLRAVFIYSAQEADKDELIKREDPDRFRFNKIVARVANKRIRADVLNPPRKGFFKRVKNFFTQ